MEIRTIGIDLGKTVFHFVGVNARGEVVVRKKGSRTQLLHFGSMCSRETRIFRHGQRTLRAPLTLH